MQFIKKQVNILSFFYWLIQINIEKVFFWLIIKIRYAKKNYWTKIWELFRVLNWLIFLTGHEGQERSCSKSFEQTQAPTPTEHALVFIRWEKLQPGSNVGELSEQLLACSDRKCIDSDRWKANTQATSECSDWSLVIVSLCFRSSSHMASDLTRSPTSSAWWRYFCSGSKRWLLEDPKSDNRTLHHTTQAREHNVGCKKISATTSPLTFRCLIP